MELYFLLLLIVLMVLALGSGYPVAFALPGSAILAVGIAALTGWLFEGDNTAYFAEGGPVQWLSAGVTNFRGIYWEAERDTLIAIPLFIFMGIMLQRSRIAEDLLVTMAQLFGPIPGGLGISVVFVGALLAATTGIVGATVVAMGLISLPAMLRHNYSKPLATGTIAASGTLGQIIPPSIVLIILADQLSASVDQASTQRKSLYKEATGELTMPSEFDVSSTSAGEMFMGAMLPGLVLVGIYMAFILGFALLRPSHAPPVPFEGRMDRRFAGRVALILVPPLALIIMVLGSIITGIATVNQAGAIGAAGALVMAGYRLVPGRRDTFLPLFLALGSLAVIFVITGLYDINVRRINNVEDQVAVTIAALGVLGLVAALIWSAVRAYPNRRHIDRRDDRDRQDHRPGLCHPDGRGDADLGLPRLRRRGVRQGLPRADARRLLVEVHHRNGGHLPARLLPRLHRDRRGGCADRGADPAGRPLGQHHGGLARGDDRA